MSTLRVGKPYSAREMSGLNKLKAAECGSGMRIPPKGHRPIARVKDLRIGDVKAAGEGKNAHLSWSKGQGRNVTPSGIYNIKQNRRAPQRDKTNMFNRSGPLRHMKES